MCVLVSTTLVPNAIDSLRQAIWKYHLFTVWGRGPATPCFASFLVITDSHARLHDYIVVVIDHNISPVTSTWLIRPTPRHTPPCHTLPSPLHILDITSSRPVTHISHATSSQHTTQAHRTDNTELLQRSNGIWITLIVKSITTFGCRIVRSAE